MSAKKKAQKTQYYGTGRRKSAVARVFLRPGKGEIIVNDKHIDEFFSRPTCGMVIRHPLQAVDMVEKFDIYITVSGGGMNGQADAAKLGIARALVQYDEATGAGEGEKSFRHMLRQAGLLTRDAREVERKKYGLKKARRSSQFSKR